MFFLIMDVERRQMSGGAAMREEPFSIRRLDERCYWMCCPTPMIRSVVNSFVFLTKGEMLVENAEGDKFIVKQNSILLVPQGGAFSVKYYKEAVGYMGGFHSGFVNCDLFRTESLFASNPIQALIQVPMDEDTANLVDAMFARMMNETRLNVPRNMIKAILVAILSLLSGEVNVSQEPLKDNISNAFLELIFDESKPLLSVKEYADHFSVTPNHLNKMIKGHTSKPVSHWIEESIIMRAKLLLLETNKTVAEVAEALNIMDQSYFSRKFKKMVGVSPLNYRSMNKKS